MTSPSLIASKSSCPSTSTSSTPPRTSSSGPGFGKRPDCDGEQLTTTRAPDSTSSSADTRSMSRWSMIATSPGLSRRVSRFVVRSRRAGPVNSRKLATLGTADRGQELGAAEHPLELLVSLGHVQLGDARVSRVAGALVDAETPVGAAGDLRQVRDRDHLRRLRGFDKRLGNSVRGLAAD